MASNAPSQSLNKSVRKDQFICGICNNQFQDPKILDCLHSFCLVCIQILSQRQDNVTVIKCPTCKCKTQVKEIEDLCSSLTLSALLEEVQIQEQLQGQGSEIKCQSCDGMNPAISRCMDCGNFLCQECHMAHETMTHLKSHEMFTMAQFKSGEVVYKSKLREFTPKCKVHSEQDLNIYCNTCEQLICSKCSILDHCCKGHSLVSPDEAMEKCKQDITELLAKAEKTKVALSYAKKETHESLEQLDSNFEEIMKKISQKAEQEIALVREQEQRLKQEAQRIYNDALFLNSMEFNPKKNQRH